MKLTEEYGIRVDPRFRTCNREALLSFGLFAAAGVASVTIILLLTAGRDPMQYGRVLGLPAYLVWGIIVVDLAFLLAVAVAIVLVFRDLPLDGEVGEDAEWHTPSTEVDAGAGRRRKDPGAELPA